MKRYLNQDHIDLVADGVTFSQASMYLNLKTSIPNLIKELTAVYSKVINNKPQKGRRRRTIATIIIPEQLVEEQ